MCILYYNIYIYTHTYCVIYHAYCLHAITCTFGTHSFGEV